MSNNLVYIAWDAKSVSRRVERAIQQDDPNTIKQTARNVQRGNEIMRSWLEEHDGDLLFAHGDEGWASVPGQKIEELQVVHSEMQDAWGDDISIGVGLDLSEAKKALDLALKRGSGNILFYTPEIEDELNDKKKDDDGLGSLLGKATPEDAPPSPQSPMGGDGAAQDAPASPVASASEHSQSEQVLANAAAAPSPAVNGVEGQFHDMAMRSEADEAQRQAQAQATQQNEQTDPSQEVEQLKQQIASILAKVKKQAPVLEQMKEQAPEAYQAITGMVQAMIAMARELMNLQGSQEAQQQQGQAQPIQKADEQLSFPSMTPSEDSPPRSIHPTTPGMVKIDLSHGGSSVSGYIPSEFYPEGVEPVGFRRGLGYQNSAFALGNNVIKVQHHRSKQDADKYLHRINRLKQLKLSTLVPILASGHFAQTDKRFTNIDMGGGTGAEDPDTSHYTYEIMKRLHPHNTYMEDPDQLIDPLRAEGYRYRDFHDGNWMKDSNDDPRLIDLEGISTIKAAKDPNDPLNQPVPVKFARQGQFVEGHIPKRWAQYGMGMLLDGGYQESTYELGGKYVLKIQHHPNITRARKYINRINRLRRLKLSTMVPVLDIGVYGPGQHKHAGQYDLTEGTRKIGGGFFTYEVMKKLHPPSGDRSFGGVATAAQEGLKEKGYHHTDLHEGNVMQDTAGNPYAIDLESIETYKSEHKDVLPGGLADKKSPKDFDTEALKEGIKVESEHTSDSRLAQEIAMDHLTEDPQYYRKLKTIEKKSEMGEREIDPNKPVRTNGKLDKAAVGPMPSAQGNLRTAATRRLPHGVEHIEIKDQGRGGNKLSRVTTVDHVTPDGKSIPARRENNTARVKGVNIAEAPYGKLHAVSAKAPNDGKGGQSAAAPQPEGPKGTTT